MLDEISNSTAIASLNAAALAEGVPENARAHARALADRLTRGVRIVVLGPKSVGKSALCNAMLSVAQMGDDQRIRVFGGALTQHEDKVLFGAGQVLPLEASVLGQAQVIDITAPDVAAEFETHIKACLEVADIVLWCTSEFTQQEARLWQTASDHLKDHSFLVLTKADILAEEGTLKSSVRALQPVVTEEFHSFFPVTTARMQNLMASNEAILPSVRTASGIAALTEAVASLVQSGQRADLDSALLFLERYGVSEVENAPIPDLVENNAVNQPPPGEPLPVTNSECDRLREQMTQKAFDLAELGFDEADGEMSQVLDLCVAISEDASQSVRLLAATQSCLTEWCDAFEDASDKIMLMTMENDTRSAADAVTILLQLRRDLEQLSTQTA